MAAQELIRVNFTISPAAWSEIDNIKEEYDKKFLEKADVVMIAWGTTMLHNGKSFDGIVIGYYNTSERRSIEHGIQKLNDREVVFFVNAETVHHFDGKVIGFERYRGFYFV